jgi:anti-sigma B factor antagonist
MRILEETSNNIGILKLTGRLDASAVKSLKENVNSLVKKDIKSIVIDLGEVDFIDSSGLGSLVSCLRLVNKETGDIRLASLQDQIRSLIELTRLHRVFQIFDDSETAVKSY